MICEGRAPTGERKQKRPALEEWGRRGLALWTHPEVNGSEGMLSARFTAIKGEGRGQK
jgi:hypothetical protein